MYINQNQRNDINHALKTNFVHKLVPEQKMIDVILILFSLKYKTQYIEHNLMFIQKGVIQKNCLMDY